MYQKTIAVLMLHLKAIEKYDTSTMTEKEATIVDFEIKKTKAAIDELRNPLKGIIDGEDLITLVEVLDEKATLDYDILKVSVKNMDKSATKKLADKTRSLNKATMALRRLTPLVVSEKTPMEKLNATIDSFKIAKMPNRPEITTLHCPQCDQKINLKA